MNKDFDPNSDLARGWGLVCREAWKQTGVPSLPVTVVMSDIGVILVDANEATLGIKASALLRKTGDLRVMMKKLSPAIIEKGLTRGIKEIADNAQPQDDESGRSEGEA